MILPVGRPRANNANQPFAKNDEKSPSRSPVKVHDEAGFPFPVRYPSEGFYGAGASQGSHRASQGKHLS